MVAKVSKPTTILRGPNGSSFITCDKCNDNVHVLFVAAHGCDISQAVKDTITVTKTEPTVSEKKASAPKKSTGEKEVKVSKKRPLSDEQSDAKPSKAGPAKKQTSKKAKEEGAPKKPLSGYFFFTADEREKAKEDGATAPAGGVAEMAKACGEKWKSMSDDEKKPFMEKAEADKERYRKERNIFEGRTEDENKPAPAAATGPKKPLTAYFLFAAEMRPKLKLENPESNSVTASAKIIGERWKALSEDEKKVYTDAAIKDKERYQQEKKDAAGETRAEDVDESPKEDEEPVEDSNGDDEVAAEEKENVPADEESD